MKISLNINYTEVVMNRSFKALLLAVCLFLASFSLASAAVQPGAFTVSPMVGYQSFDSNLDIDDSAVYGIAAGYNLDRNWAFELDVRYAPTEADFAGGPDVDVWTVTGNVLYHFQPEQTLVPYLVAGIGGLQYDVDGWGEDEDFVFNWGGGIKYALAQDIDLRLDLRHVVDFRTDNRGDADDDDVSNNVAATVGLNFQFGK